MLRRLDRVYVFLADLLALAAAVSVLIMVVIVTLNVGLRGTGLGSITWTDEVSEYLLYAVTLLSAPWLLRRGGHISIDVLFSFLGIRAAHFARIVGASVCLVATLVTAWTGLRVTSSSLENGTMTFKSLVFPEWWLILPLPIIFALLVVEFTRQIVGCRND